MSSFNSNSEGIASSQTFDVRVDEIMAEIPGEGDNITIKSPAIDWALLFGQRLCSF